MEEDMDRPRGTRDLWGEELRRVRKVQEKLKNIFKNYGYEEVETPIFEKLELFTKKSGSEIRDQIYHFEDKSGRELALRPELTAPSMRLYNSDLKSEPKPLKIFYFGPCFRYERPQAGRWRQFLQAGVELIGSSRPEADAEVIALTNDSFESLGMEDYTLRIGHIGLLRRILEFGNVSGEKQDPILRAIDSKDPDRLKEELKASELAQEAQGKLWDIIELRGGFEIIEEAENVLRQVPDADNLTKNLREILERLEHMEINHFEVDLGIARGLEYYTGAVFEVYFDEVQLGGGGRYDGLVESLGGEPTPAVGVGLGIDRVAQTLEDQDIQFEPDDIDAIVLPTEESMLKEGLSIAKRLRDEEFRVDTDLKGRSLGKGLGYADSRGIKHAIIVGPDDVSEGKVTIKNMKTGEQRQVLKENVAEKLKG